MNATVEEYLLQRHPISYAVTNGSGVIVEQVGDPTLLYGAPVVASGIGRRLVDVVPELATEQDNLLLLLQGAEDENGEPISFQWVHRNWLENPTGETPSVDAHGNMPALTVQQDRRYIHLTVRSRRKAEGVDGLICLAEEVTAQGRIHQELMQQRNELSLLQQSLVEQNRELRAANVELRLMNDAQASFCSLAAHKLRNPLTSIYGYLEMMLEETSQLPAQDQRLGLEAIQKNALRLLDEVTNLVDAARIDANRIELVLRPTSAASLLERAVEQARLPLELKAQTLEQHIESHLPILLCDAKRAVEAIGHLLNNASKFSPEGTAVLLSATMMPMGDFLHIAVTDSGEGVSHSVAENLFSPPHQIQGNFHSNTSETGLGLYIARSLVELHGGQLWYDSEPGRGSRFHITLPVLDSLTAGEDAPQNSADAPDSASKNAWDLTVTRKRDTAHTCAGDPIVRQSSREQVGRSEGG